jgi:hypothetical protein
MRGVTTSLMGRCCRKSLFASLNANFPSCRCGDPTIVWGKHHKAMNSPATSATGLRAYRRAIVACFVFEQEISRKAVWTFSTAALSRWRAPSRCCCLPWLDTSPVRSARFRPVFQPFFSVVGRCVATRVRSDSSRNDLRLRSLDGAFSSPCCKTGTFCARGQRAIASADGQASKLRPSQCQGRPRHLFSCEIKTKRPVEVRI